jgi:hypothetical protein
MRPMRTRLLLALIPIAPTLAFGQRGDPIQLDVGSPLVDGRIYKAHDATATRSVTKDGVVLRSITYTNHTYLTTWKGRAVCVVESKPNAQTTDTSFYEKTVLDARTMALLHREQRDGGGRLVDADVDGVHVTGRYRAKSGAPVDTLDFTLAAPSYDWGFVDAAIGATHMREGQSWRVPTFGLSPSGRTTLWENFRITGHDRGTWIIENADDAPVHTKIWITEDPPYLPLVLTTLPDGSIAKFESTLR